MIDEKRPLLCRLGLHDLRIEETTTSGAFTGRTYEVERVERCVRCPLLRRRVWDLRRHDEGSPE